MNRHLQNIRSIFRATKDLADAHKQIVPVLKSIVEDYSFLHEIIKQNLNNVDFLNKKRHYPTLALSVYKDELLDVVVNIFPSLPEGADNVSFQSVHHHGNLMLSSAALSGPGYESIIFKDNFKINPHTREVQLNCSKHYINNIKNIEFIAPYTPHIVFYPTSFSSTLAVWSKNEHSKINRLKSSANIMPFKKTLVNLSDTFGLNKILKINKVELFDFYPRGETFFALHDRIGYPESNNSNFLQNLFHFLQTVDFDDTSFLTKLHNKESTSKIASQWIEKYLNKDPIYSLFDPVHLNIDNRVNIKRQDIINTCK